MRRARLVGQPAGPGEPQRSQWQRLVRKLEEAERGGTTGAGPGTVGDLPPGMLLGTAYVHLASVPPLPIKIKKLIFFCLPLRTKPFL